MVVEIFLTCHPTSTGRRTSWTQSWRWGRGNVHHPGTTASSGLAFSSPGERMDTGCACNCNWKIKTHQGPGTVVLVADSSGNAIHHLEVWHQGHGLCFLNGSLCVRSKQTTLRPKRGEQNKTLPGFLLWWWMCWPYGGHCTSREEK